MSKPIFDEWQDATKVLPFANKMCLLELLEHDRIDNTIHKYVLGKIFYGFVDGNVMWCLNSTNNEISNTKVKRWCYVIDIGNKGVSN